MKVWPTMIVVSAVACSAPPPAAPAHAGGPSSAPATATPPPAGATAFAPVPAAPAASGDDLAPAGAPPSSAAPAPSISPSPPAHSADAIDRLVAQLAGRPLWTNGSFSAVTLPPSSSTAEVLAAVLAKVRFDGGPVRSHQVVEERVVQIGTDPTRYTAVLTKTDRGPKIVLLRHAGSEVGWWSRVFEPPP